VRHCTPTNTQMTTLRVILEDFLELVRGLTATILLIAVFVGIVAGSAMGVFGSAPEQVIVPTVVGLSVKDAEAALKSVGLALRVGERRYDDETPQDAVIESKPYEGKWVKRGRAVVCVISLGTRNVAVPKVTGLTIDLAEERLRKAGLSIEDIRRKASARPRNRVLEQYPKPGAKLGRNQGVVVMASGGKGFGSLPAADGSRWLCKRARFTVPRGAPLQRVQVVLIPGEADKEYVYDRVHRPGDDVRVNVTGRKGWRVKVLLVGKEILAETL